MKNKHKIRFVNAYKWWDYTFLIQAIEDWCLHASKKHLTEGHLLRAEETAHVLKVIAVLCKRIREDNYKYKGIFITEETCDMDFKDVDGGYTQLVFTNYSSTRDKYKEYIKKSAYYMKNQKQQDLDYLCKLLSKHMFSLWD